MVQSTEVNIRLLIYERQAIFVKNITRYIKNTSILGSVVFQLIVSLFAFSCSFYVEYIVFDGWLITESNTDDAVAKIITCLIVISIEIFKILSIFWAKRYEKNGKKEESFHFIAVHYITVGLSFLCTFIFLCNPMYDADSAKNGYETVINEINARYTTQEEKVHNDYEADWKAYSDNLDAELKALEDTIHNIEKKPKIGKNYENYKAHLESLRTNYNNTKDKNTSLKKEYNQESKKQEEQEIQDLEQKKDAEILAAKRSAENYSEGDNHTIRQTLLFLSSLIGAQEYPRLIYFLVVFTLTIIISFLLENIISAFPNLMSMDYAELETFLGISKEDGPAKATGIYFLVYISLAIVAYVFVAIIANQHAEINGYIATVASMALAGYVSKKDILGEHKDSSSFSLKQIGLEMLNSVPQLIISLACFLVLSATILKTNGDIMPASVALSFGNIGGRIILTNSNC